MSTDALHEIVSDLKRVAIDLGRTPTYTEYFEQGLGRFSERQLRKHFGGFSPAIQAAGLQPPKRKDSLVKDLIKEGFTKSPLEIRVSERRKFNPEQTEPIAFHKSIAILGDTHFPFHDSEALDEVIKIIEKLKPDAVIQLGDLYDMFSFSKFPKSADLILPREEAEHGQKSAIDMWDKIKKASPNATCYQILGNHDVRPLKRLLEVYPAGELFFSVGRFFQFDNVKTFNNPREELILDIAGEKVAFLHGYRSKLGDHRDYMLMNAVCGHSHRGGVSYRQLQGKMIWELNAGFLGGVNEALSYNPQRMTNWTLGMGYIDELGPRFISL